MRFWLLARQVAATALYCLSTIRQRRRSAVVLMLGMAGATVAHVGVFSVADGLRAALVSGADDRVAVVLQEGAMAELDSRLPREAAAVIAGLPQVEHLAGRALVSGENVAVVSLPGREGGALENVLLRGVTDAGFEVRGRVEVHTGRRFRSGRYEAIVGTRARDTYDGLDPGSDIRLAGRPLRIVGVFSAGGHSEESEIWTSDTAVRESFGYGSNFQAIRVRLTEPEVLWDFEGGTLADRRLRVAVERETEFYRNQAEIMTLFVESFGWLVVVLMGGAVSVVTFNTTFGAISSRRREIGTLRALGFGRFPVVAAFLAEAGSLAVAGAALGAGVSGAALDGFRTSTLNFASLSQLVFTFQVGGGTVIQALLLAVGISLLGGVAPAISAARTPIRLAVHPR